MRVQHVRHDHLKEKEVRKKEREKTPGNRALPTLQCKLHTTALHTAPWAPGSCVTQRVRWLNAQEPSNIDSLMQVRVRAS